MPKMITLQQAADLTGLKYCTLRLWCKNGTFTFFVKAGNKYLLNKDRLLDFLNTPAEIPAKEAGVRR